MLNKVSFEVKFGLHQGSVLGPYWVHCCLLVMDVISSEAIRDLCSELLYADDLWHQQWSSLVDVWLNG